MDDDELGRLIRSLDPVAPEDPAHREAREERVWARISEAIAADRTTSPKTPRSQGSRRTRLWWGISLPALATAVVALLVVLVVNPFSAPAPAAALGLPPLRYEASDLSLSEHIDRAREQLAAGDGPSEPMRDATTVAWYVHVTMDGPARGTVVSPEVMTITWDEDFEMHYLVTAGRSFVVADDGSQPRTRDDLAEEGTVLRDEMVPGEHMIVDGEPLPFLVPGSGFDFYRQYIAETVALSGGGAAEALHPVTELLNYWTLTNAQHADLLAVLGEYDGLELLGITHDRAGREVFGISAVTSTGYHRNVLLVSTETGRIVGNETVYLAEDPGFPLPTGSVMSYQMWDLDPAR